MSRRPFPLLFKPRHKHIGLILADLHQLRAKVLASFQLVDGVSETPGQIVSKRLVHWTADGMAAPDNPRGVPDRAILSHNRVVRNLLRHIILLLLYKERIPARLEV